LALTRTGELTRADSDIAGLFTYLGDTGYGWLRPEGVRRKLEEMAANWQGPPPLPGDNEDPAAPDDDVIQSEETIRLPGAEEEPEAARERSPQLPEERQATVLRGLLRIVIAGAVVLAIAYYALNWIGGPQFNFLGLPLPAFMGDPADRRHQVEPEAEPPAIPQPDGKVEEPGNPLHEMGPKPPEPAMTGSDPKEPPPEPKLPIPPKPKPDPNFNIEEQEKLRSAYHKLKNDPEWAVRARAALWRSLTVYRDWKYTNRKTTAKYLDYDAESKQVLLEKEADGGQILISRDELSAHDEAWMGKIDRLRPWILEDLERIRP